MVKRGVAAPYIKRVREELESFDRFLEDFEALNVCVDRNGIATGLVRTEPSA